MKRIIAVLLFVIGLVVAIVTAVQTSNQETETTVEVTVPAGDSTVVYTQPGVLELVDDSVEVTLSAPGETIQWAFGRPGQVEAWVGESAATSIEGLKSWAEAKYSTTPGEEARVAQDKRGGERNSFSLLASDLWIEEETAEDEVTFTYEPAADAQQVLIATTSAAQAPEVTLAWKHEPPIANPVPVIAIGVLLSLVGLFLLLQDQHARSKGKKKATKKATVTKDVATTDSLVSQDDSATTVLPAFTGDLAEQDREVQRQHTDRALGAGILPGTARTEELRNRELDPADRLEIPAVGPDPEADAQAAAHRDDVERQHAQDLKSTDRALGAAILPGTSRTQELRDRELDPKDRVILPVAEADETAVVDNAVHGVTDEGNETEPTGVVRNDDPVEEAPDNTEREMATDSTETTDEGSASEADKKTGEEPNWRSLWNFEWGSPYRPKGDNDA